MSKNATIMIVPQINSEILSFSSSWEIEAMVQNHVDLYGRLKDPFIRQQYNRFNLDNQTLSSLLLTICYFFLFSLSFLLVTSIEVFSSVNPTKQIENRLFTTVLIIVCIIINVAALSAYYYLCYVIKIGQNTLSQQSKKLILHTQQGLVLLFHLLVCMGLIGRVITGPCDVQPRELLQTSFCNPLYNSAAIPADSSLLVMMIPILYILSVKGTHLSFTMLLWLISLTTLVFTCVYMWAASSVASLLLHIMGSLTMIFQANRMSHFMFFAARKLEETLQEREKAANEANALEMRHMIANVAHDLKTPLASLFCGIELVEQVTADMNTKVHEELESKSLCPDDVSELLQSVTSVISNMRTSNSFMLMAINRCLDYTKASKGVKLMPKYDTIDLQQTMLLPLNCMKDTQQRIQISLDPLSSEICNFVITDQQWLQENLLCLLSNAVKYSYEGDVHLSVRLLVNQQLTEKIGRENNNEKFQAYNDFAWASLSPRRKKVSSIQVNHLPEAMFLRFEVEDHGVGLSQEAMSILFSPFKQAQRLAGGTGLGLFSLAKRIEALDGTCGVENRRDGMQGSLFWFQIPYRPDVQLAQRVQNGGLRSPRGLNSTCPSTPIGRTSQISLLSSKESVAPTVSESTSPLKVLVVDDSPTILKTTSMMLKRNKHVVHTAVNGAEAVKMVAERYEHFGTGYDVILMDLQMPIMDGLEATRRLRQMQCLPKEDVRPSSRTVANVLQSGHQNAFHQIIIGVSANSDIETATEAYRAGVDAFFTKPFVMEAFIRAYRQAIEKQQQGDS